MFIKTKRVRRANRTYEYLTLAVSVRINGKNTLIHAGSGGGS
jgi:hypothetical protein